MSSRKISKEEFLKRFYNTSPDEDIEIIEYTAISNPCIIKCNKCKKIYKKNKAEYFIENFKCCGDTTKKRYDRLVSLYSNNKDFVLIKQLDKGYVLLKHLQCGNEIKRRMDHCLKNPNSCPHCNTRNLHNYLPIEEVQKRLDETFSNSIKILEYNGEKRNSTFKCLKCGLIFQKKTENLILKSRGCPKCDKVKYKGESFMEKLFIENSLNYKTQVSIPDLPLQKFDFAIYDDDNNLLCYVELQGDQHFIDRNGYFSDSLEKIQERDNRKRKYCKENNITLYEIIYRDGRFKNLDILPFLDSTTIPTKGSRPASNF